MRYTTLKLCCVLCVVAFSCIQISAQQKAFAVNSQNNPLKNFVIASNKESHPFFIDIDGDGDLDCFSGEYSNVRAAQIYFYRNDGTNKNPQFKQVTGDANALSKVAANALSIPFFIDIDGDGDYDCFIGEGTTGAIMYYKNTGTATHPVLEKQSAAFNPLSGVKFWASGVASPSFADVDGDGDYDCLVSDEDGNENYFKNTGDVHNPSFVHVNASEDPFSSVVFNKGMYNVSFYDWNKDGLPDLFVNTTYYKNVGTVGKPAFIGISNDKPLFQNKSEDRYAYAPLRWVDINNDGAVEVFQGNTKGSFVYQTSSSNIADATVSAPSARVFPNPSKEEFVVNLPVSNAQTIVRVTDMQGKLITTLATSSSFVKFGKDFKAGAYMVQVLQNNKAIFSQKIIKE